MSPPRLRRERFAAAPEPPASFFPSPLSLSPLPLAPVPPPLSPSLLLPLSGSLDLDLNFFFHPASFLPPCRLPRAPSPGRRGPRGAASLPPSPDPLPRGRPEGRSRPSRAPLGRRRCRFLREKPSERRHTSPSQRAADRPAKWEMRQVILWKCARTLMLMKLKG